MVVYTRRLIDTIRLHDARRPISTGFAVARPNAWHAEFCRGPGVRHGRTKPTAAQLSDPCADGVNGVDSVEQWGRMVGWQHEGADIVSTHVYANKGCWFSKGAHCTRQDSLNLTEAVARLAAREGKLLYVGEYGGTKPNHTGPTAEAQAFPEALLRWQVAHGEHAPRRGGSNSHAVPSHTPARRPVLSSIWAWECASHRHEMQCIYPNSDRPSDSGSGRMVALLRQANAQLEAAELTST